MGQFKIFDMKGELLGVFDNHFVTAGKKFALDFMFGNECWIEGGVWNANRYIGIGRTSNTNAGTVGPASGALIATGGAWQGVSNADYKLSDEITGAGERALLTSAEIVGRTAHLAGIIGDDNIDYGGSGYVDIYELGIFLHSGYGDFGNPDDAGASDASKNHAMVIRAVSYYRSGTGYAAKYCRKYQGQDWLAEYTFSDFEGGV